MRAGLQASGEGRGPAGAASLFGGPFLLRRLGHSGPRGHRREGSGAPGSAVAFRARERRAYEDPGAASFAPSVRDFPAPARWSNGLLGASSPEAPAPRPVWPQLGLAGGHHSQQHSPAHLTALLGLLPVVPEPPQPPSPALEPPHTQRPPSRPGARRWRQARPAPGAERLRHQAGRKATSRTTYPPFAASAPSGGKTNSSH